MAEVIWILGPVPPTAAKVDEAKVERSAAVEVVVVAKVVEVDDCENQP
jgi:hypothetical protein